MGVLHFMWYLDLVDDTAFFDRLRAVVGKKSYGGLGALQFGSDVTSSSNSCRCGGACWAERWMLYIQYLMLY